MQHRIQLGTLFRPLLPAILLKLLVAGAAVHAQVPSLSAETCPAWTPLVTLGSHSNDRQRLSQVLGASETGGSLIRSPSGPAGEYSARPRALCVQWLTPELRSVWNSAIPFSQNEGMLWAGRGSNLLLLAGARAQFGRISLTLAPQMVYAENREFRILREDLYHRLDGRSPFASIWHTRATNWFDPGLATVDMPYRFGDRPVSSADWGQSSLAVSMGPLQAGIAHENQWWGPGIRNALVLSNHAPGFGHLFLRTARPLRSAVGTIEARWLVGELRESAHFDTISGNNLRSLSGMALTLSPAWERRLTLGVARAVISPVSRRSQVGDHALRVFTDWERRDSASQLEWEPQSDQVLSVFGRWVFPQDGVEVYGEWARHELPVSLRDFLLAPHHTQGYTLGAQWAHPVHRGALRLQGEVTYLEQSATLFLRPSDTFYTGRASPHGYTHRGQVLGAAIGPGSSSQWLALDYLRPSANIGVFGGRIRWENDALYTSHSLHPGRGFNRTLHAHDVSILAGLRGGFERWGFEVQAELTTALRYNYLFQNPDVGFGPDGAVDIRNHTLRLSLTPSPGYLPPRRQ